MPTISISLPISDLVWFDRRAEEIRTENPGARVSRNDLIRSAISRGIQYWAMLQKGDVVIVPREGQESDGSDSGTTGPKNASGH